jgi:hypothetical protein
MTIPLLVVGTALSLTDVPHANDVVVPVAAPETIKSPWVISCVKVELPSNILEAVSALIINGLCDE